MNRTRALAIVLMCLGIPPAFVVATGAVQYFDNLTTGTIELDGETREYIVHAPSGYTGTAAVPLVLSMHGAGTWPSLQKTLSGWNRLADAHGFIVAYPGGEGVAFKVFDERDPAMIVALIEKLQAAYNIDPGRIYVNGLSNGGGTSYALSCVLSDRIAAVGTVAPAITMSADLCPGAQPVPLIAFFGADDKFTPLLGGKVFIAPQPFPSLREWAANWARRNRCASTTRESRVAPDVTRTEFDNCAAPVIAYTIEGGGHTWPGHPGLPVWFVGATTRSIDATELMWAFFKEHPLSH